MNELYHVEVSDFERGKKSFPAFTCGHCSGIVMVNPKRSERRTCMSCSRWICGTNELCNEKCTPLHAMADDHFEGAGEFASYVPAIMQGVTSLDEGKKKGLILP